jgi:hypothetical protein
MMPLAEAKQAAGGGGGAGASSAKLKEAGKPVETLPCPRCESMNTKFCYYNNYSVTQPRHFCRQCQRYWTAGGTLRNVPVGGGSRKKNRGPRIEPYHQHHHQQRAMHMPGAPFGYMPQPTAFVTPDMAAHYGMMYPTAVNPLPLQSRPAAAPGLTFELNLQAAAAAAAAEPQSTIPPQAPEFTTLLQPAPVVNPKTASPPHGSSTIEEEGSTPTNGYSNSGYEEGDAVSSMWNEMHDMDNVLFQ